MKAAEKIIRLILASILIVVAGDMFFRFLKLPEPSMEAQNFLISLSAAGYIWPAVGGVSLISGILLLIKRFIGVALVLLFPVTANIALFTVFMDQTMVLGTLICVLHIAVAAFNWRIFRPLFGL